MLAITLSLWASFSVLLGSGPNHQVFLEPMDLQANESNHFLSAIYQIECEGERLFFRGGTEPYILITDLEGSVQKTLGGKGGHPSEFGELGVLAMAVQDGTISAIDKKRRFIRFYVDDRFDSAIRLDSFHPWATHSTSNIFAFSKDQVVVPTLDTKFLALAYHRQSEAPKPLGETLYIGNDFVESKDLNATLWCYRNGLWYAAHKFFPMITVFDKSFKLVNQFQISHELTDSYIDYLSNFYPDDHFNRPQPLITDLKWFRNSLFLMMQGRLVQVDPNLGTVAAVVSMYGKGKNFGPADGKRVTLPFFAFSDDGTLFVAHPGLLWNHDFWRVRGPFGDQARLNLEPK